MHTSREAAGLTQRQLASRAGVSLGAVQDIEQGRTIRPRLASLARLAAALRLSSGQLEEMISASNGTVPAGHAVSRDQLPGSGAGGDGRLRLEVLGPLTVWREGVPVALGPVRQRAVLGLLAMHPDTGLRRTAIIDALWGDDPPATAVAIIQAYVSRIRRLLGPGPARGRGGMLSWDGSCYRLSPESLRLDVAEFSELTERARQAAAAGDGAGACEMYERAMRVWRGQALADIELLAGDPAVTSLGRQRAAVVIEYADAAAAAGLDDRVVAHLDGLTGRDPLDERAHARLMVALAAMGQQAAALRVYQDLAGRLDGELGVNPGPELAEAHLKVLRQEIPPAPALAAHGPAPDPSGPAGPRNRAAADPVPRQLPAAVCHFTGRAAEMKTLSALASQAAAITTAAGDGGTAISVISGTAGVGKTALAIQFAHRAMEWFPDGQLYVNLRGFDPSGTPVTAAEAIQGFLGAFGVPAERVRGNTQAQAGLYRSLLAGRRMLIVLDNARDADQVRPLLPGSPGCLALVTIRNQLISLVAAEGAHPITLDVLSEADARALLARRLGQERVAGELEVVTQLTQQCARLPLALAIAAARAVTQPYFPLRSIVTELRDVTGRLDALDGGEAATSVRAVFSWSYQSLSSPAARMFRLLSVHPGPDITAPAAASLTGLPLRQARLQVGELTSAHLLTEHAPGRFAFHDLLRAYAAEQAVALDSDAAREVALHRVLDHYVHSAYAASRLVNPSRDPITLTQPQPGALPECPAGYAEALDWLDAEHQALLAVIGRAAEAGFDTHAWQIPWTLVTFFQMRGHNHDLAATQLTALAAARRRGDVTGQAHAHRNLGRARALADCCDEAHAHLSQALRFFRELGDRVYQACTHQDIGMALDSESKYLRALSHDQQALELFRTVGHRRGLANSLNAVGLDYAHLGDYSRALSHCQQALNLCRELALRHEEAATWDSLGYAHHQLGHHSDAAACYGRALGLCRDLGNRCGQAEALIHLGDTHQASGDARGARDAWTHALAILDSIHDPGTETVRAKLAGLNAAPR